MIISNSEDATVSRRIRNARLSAVALLPIALLGPAMPIQAQDEPIEIEAVVVEPEGEPEADKPLGIGISGDTLRSTPGSGGDPLRGLQSLPGMSFTDDQSPLPAVRGSRPGDNYFEADFVPVGYLFHAGGVVSVFNADLVESFDIYPSAYGPQYGGVTGAVFDVKLRDPQRDRLRATLDINFLQAGALVEGPVTDDQSFYLAGRLSYLDLLIEDQLEEDDGVTFVQFPKYTDYQGKYLWTPSDRTSVRLQANGATDEQELDIADDSTEIEQDPIFAGRSFDRTRFDEQALVWEQTLGTRTRVESAISHSNSSSEAQAGNAGVLDLVSDSWRLKSHATIGLSDTHDLAFGGTATRSDNRFLIDINDPGCTEFEADCRFTGSERRRIEEDLTINAARAFVQDSWYVNDALTLQPGLAFQTEDYLDESFVEPRFSLEYSVSDSLVLSAGTGLYRQFPGLLETDDVFGNPDLEYIESIHYVIGAETQWNNAFELKTELYYKSLDNLVSGDETLRYTNGGEGHAYGLDTLVRASVSDTLSGWLSLSLSEARRENTTTGDSFPFEYDQPVNLNVVVNYEPSSLWTFSAKLWVHSGSLYTPIVGASADDEIDGLFNPEYGPINSERFPTYHRLDLRADRHFALNNGRTFDLYAEILNLFDTDNVSFYDYNADYSQRSKVTQLPLIVGLGINMTL